MATNQAALPVVLTAPEISALPELRLGGDNDVTHRVLWADEHSSAGILRIPGGQRLGRHTHRANDHHLWVIEGRVEILGVELGPGGYSHVPFGVEHDIDATNTEGCVVYYLYNRSI